MFASSLFFDLVGQTAAPLLESVEYVWDALPRIKQYINDIIKPNVADLRKQGEVLAKTHVIWNGRVLDRGFVLEPGDATKGKFIVRGEDGQVLEGAVVVYAGAALMDDNIQLRPGVVVEPGALIKGPTILGEQTEARQGAYLRGGCLIGRKCVVGHTTEAKNVIMLDGAKAGHFAYLGDSILGREVNLGAGTKLANLKIVDKPIAITYEDRKIMVDFRKFGAILGDGVETGCNSVTSPGTVMGKRCLVTPTITVPAGYHPARTIIRPPKRKS